MKELVKTTRNGLVKLKAKLADAKPVLNKDGSTRKNNIHSTLKEKISATEIQLEDMREKARQEPDRVKTSDLEDYREYKQVDNEGKKLFDFITSSVWNSRKDMVDLLRLQLEPLEQPRRRFAQEQLCRKLTYLATRLPMGRLLVMEVDEDSR